MSALANDEVDPYGLDRALAEEIRVLLVRRGLKQADLAAALGVTPGAVSHRLTGRTELTVRELGQLSAFFDVAPADLLGAFGHEVFSTTPRYLLTRAGVVVDLDVWRRERRATRRTYAPPQRLADVIAIADRRAS